MSPEEKGTQSLHNQMLGWVRQQDQTALSWLRDPALNLRQKAWKLIRGIGIVTLVVWGFTDPALIFLVAGKVIAGLVAGAGGAMACDYLSEAVGPTLQAPRSPHAQEESTAPTLTPA